jgi:hypothetical protein
VQAQAGGAVASRQEGEGPCRQEELEGAC